MEQTLVAPEDLDTRTEEEVLVHEWRAEQLSRLGFSTVLAHTFAPRVDWHEIAALIERGCPPHLALEIVR